MTGAAYQAMRRQWKPECVRLLLVGESAPDPQQAAVRFFYAPTLTQYDNLFRGVIQALYGRSPGRSGDPKQPWLERLKTDGVYLIDLVPFPVNSLGKRERRAARRAHVGPCVDEAAGLAPDAVAVCHGETFADLRAAMVDADLPIIHSQPLPFPTGNWRERFATDLAAAVKAAGLQIE